ncbi:MAG TPA: thiamine pyrophosphate-binding protein, partial [Nocardioides sp.]|nr:thiamine pyrophosphate-binding protein [Nocardioides sp.]
MRAAEAVGRTLVGLGVSHVFGVVGSGNFHVTNAMVRAGARFVAARHEGGATTMADAYARMSGEVAAVTVHQGCGFTNTLTGLTEATKSRTPLVVLAADVTERRSNFFVDQQALTSSVGATPLSLERGEDAVAMAARAFALARDERRTVVLNLPLQVQAAECDEPPTLSPAERSPESATAVAPDQLDALLACLDRARRPVFVAGRGARGAGCREALEALAESCGALVGTSAVSKGLFHGNPWDIDVSGGFATPLAVELITDADLIVGWGCALNMWTMRQGSLIGPDTVVAQVDIDPDALGNHRDVQL